MLSLLTKIAPEVTIILIALELLGFSSDLLAYAVSQYLVLLFWAFMLLAVLDQIWGRKLSYRAWFSCVILLLLLITLSLLLFVSFNFSSVQEAGLVIFIFSSYLLSILFDTARNYFTNDYRALKTFKQSIATSCAILFMAGVALVMLPFLGEMYKVLIVIIFLALIVSDIVFWLRSKRISVRNEAI